MREFWKTCISWAFCKTDAGYADCMLLLLISRMAGMASEAVVVCWCCGAGRRADFSEEKAFKYDLSPVQMLNSTIMSSLG